MSDKDKISPDEDAASDGVTPVDGTETVDDGIQAAPDDGADASDASDAEQGTEADSEEEDKPRYMRVRPPLQTQQFLADRSIFFFRVLRNWVGLFGTVLFVTALVTFLFFFFIEMAAGGENPYLGLFHFLILPPVVALGLVMMGFGYWVERRKKRLALESGEVWAPLDIRRTRVQQRLLLTAGTMSSVAIFAMLAGGYRAYEFTESTNFCGELCHSVMHPEFIAYQNSAHARVSCVDCHVGPGASFYVKSKLSGLYQVYAVLRNIYPKPIPTPVHNLRPAQETCEQCHWPSFFFGDRRRVFSHYLTDGTEEPWEIDMLIHIGGGDPDKGYTRGIHWHMNIANQVEYIARDDQRQEIPWVRITDERENATVYQDAENPLTEEEIAGAEIRTMDCIDCHNRPSHIYRNPVELVNRELQLGNISSAMPDIKFLALEVLATEYESTEAADMGITTALRDAYARDFPDYYAENRDEVDEAAVILRRVFNENMFPDMGVRWDVYPDFIGHWGTAGCFRCHAGNLRSSDNRTISTECNSCHTILSQGFRGDPLPSDGPGAPFVHPGDMEVMDYPILCHECHDGALGLAGG